AVLLVAKTCSTVRASVWAYTASAASMAPNAASSPTWRATAGVSRRYTSTTLQPNPAVASSRAPSRYRVRPFCENERLASSHPDCSNSRACGPREVSNSLYSSSLAMFQCKAKLNHGDHGDHGGKQRANQCE